MEAEDDLLPLSLISQFGYCPRRAGLIMIDRQWEENIHTTEGEIEHERVHETNRSLRRDEVELLAVPVRSNRLGVLGVLDALELTGDKTGVAVRGLQGKWRLFPIEYKHGRIRREREYELQLCAQAICLEEMLGCVIESGALFYAGAHRRQPVDFTVRLREQVYQVAASLHTMREHGIIPAAVESKKCPECSLVNVCMPDFGRGVDVYLQEVRQIAEGKTKS